MIMYMRVPYSLFCLSVQIFTFNVHYCPTYSSVVRVPDSQSEGPGFDPQLGPDFSGLTMTQLM